MLDKKSVKNSPYFVLLDRIGTPHVSKYGYTMPVEPSYLDQALSWAKEYFKPQTFKT